MSQLERFRPDLKLSANRTWVENYLLGKPVYPISLEVDPTNKCPLNCPHCVWYKYRHTDQLANASLSETALIKIVNEAAEIKVKGI